METYTISVPKDAIRVEAVVMPYGLILELEEAVSSDLIGQTVNIIIMRRDNHD